MTQVGGPRRGSAFAELAFAMPVLALVLLGAMDLARAFHVSINVAAAAGAGAAFGSRSPTSPDDSSGITLAAQQAAPGVASLTVTPAKLCGCADGSLGVCASIFCTPKYTYIQVKTQTTFSTLCPYPGIPSSFPVSWTVLTRAK